MRLTAQEVYEKLIHEDKICELEGQIRFYLGDVNIIVKQRDVVGNIMQEWLQGWLVKNGIEFAPSENSQMPPDFFLNPDDQTRNLLEVKAFNRNASPGFDIADFRMYQSEIIKKPYMLDVDYLIFGYEMSDEGIVTIKDIWLKKVWEITRRMEDWPINLQIKEGHVHKIRPGVWYNGDLSRTDFAIFECLEDFISAMDQTVYQNEETRKDAQTWLLKFQKNYEERNGGKLAVPRWYEIADKYDIKKARRIEKAKQEVQKAQTGYDKQNQKVLDAEEKYKAMAAEGNKAKIERAETTLKKEKERWRKYSQTLADKKTALNKLGNID